MTDPALAVTLSVAALVVSLAAAIFTGWQAVTAHLQRTRPRGATFTLSKGEPSWTDWRLTNTGGSVASEVSVTIKYLFPKGKAPYVAHAPGPVKPDQTVTIPGSGSRSLPTGRYVPADDPGKWRQAGLGERGRRAIQRKARVTWRDYRGRTRSGRVLLW